MCGHKRRLSEPEAYRVRNRFRDQGDYWIQVYRCKICGAWHVGHTPRRTRNVIQKIREGL